LGEKAIESKNHCIAVSCLLERDREALIRESLRDYSEVSFKQCSPPGLTSLFRQLRSSPFHRFLEREHIDVVLFAIDPLDPYSSTESSYASERNRSGCGKSPAAMIGVIDRITELQLSDVSKWYMDGWLAAPFISENIYYEIQMALDRRNKRLREVYRYEKVRNFSRNLNRKRHILRDQVDLLCNDLVQGNKQITGTCNDLMNLCDFQYDLIGEYDIQVLLHRSLQKMRETLGDSNIALWLAESNEIEAHILNSPFAESMNQSQFEHWIGEIILPPVVESGKVVKMSGTKPSDLFLMPVGTSEWSVMGLPLNSNGTTVGVIVAYRQGDKPYNEQDVSKASGYLDSLGRAVGSGQALSRLVEKSL
jgi:hypothetical protein